MGGVGHPIGQVFGAVTWAVSGLALENYGVRLDPVRKSSTPSA